MAKRLGAKHTVARIRDLSNNDDNLQFMREQTDLSLAINPELLTAQAIYNLLKLPSATRVQIFAGRGFEMVELALRAESLAVGQSLIEFRKKSKIKFLVCTVNRNGIITIPRGDFIFREGDKITVISATRDAYRLPQLFGLTTRPSKSVIIAGANRTVAYLAQLLSGNKNNIKVISYNREKCEQLNDLLGNKISVICGDPTNTDLLIEEGIRSTDALVSLTHQDETDILLSFYALSQKVPKVICNCDKPELAQIAENLGLDSVISPRRTTADLIVQYARALHAADGSHIETVYSLQDGNAEAVEFEVLDNTRFTNIPLKSLKLKPDMLLAGIHRGKENIIPNGDDMIMVGDKIIVVASGRHLVELDDILAG
jgi:trk system potassium uptake protein TrkA